MNIDEISVMSANQTSSPCIASSEAGPAVSGGVTPGRGDGSRSLFDFAYFANVSKALERLAGLAAPEDWSRRADPFTGVTAKPYAGLESYLRSVFSRAYDQGLVSISQDGSMCVFNTGLKSRYGIDVLACFEYDSCVWHKEWKFQDFCEVGTGLGGYALKLFYGMIPLAPSFDRIPFVAGKPIYCDYAHVISSRVWRLPARLFSGSMLAREALSELEKLPPLTSRFDREQLCREICNAVRHDEGLVDALRRALQDALARSMRLWSLREDAAAMRYKLQTGSTVCLLPLWLDGKREPDVVAVIEDLGPCLHACTVLRLDDARVSARVTASECPWWLDSKAAVPAEAIEVLGIGGVFQAETPMTNEGCLLRHERSVVSAAA